MAKRITQGEPRDLIIFPPPNSAIGQQYYYVTQRPWPSLVFILPGLLFFEIGTYLTSNGEWQGSQLVAPYLIEWLVDSLRSGHDMPRLLAAAPGLLLVAILLAWHLAARHPWKFDPSVLPGMLGESMVYTIPLIVFMYVTRGLVLAGTTPAIDPQWIYRFMRCFGAGIYEELVFRLICITVLVIVLIDLMRLPRGPAALFIIAISAVLFALQHHKPLGSEDFNMANFAFRVAAGVYLAGLFVFRGFGVAVGCHAFYNVLIEVLQAMHSA